MQLLPVSTFDALDLATPFYDDNFRGVDMVVRLGPGQKERVESTILRTYLPGIRRFSHYTYRGNYNLEPFFYRSEAVRLGRVSQKTLRHTFAMLLCSLAQNVGTSEAPTIDISRMLDDALLRDEQIPQIRTTHVFKFTFARFASLCDIAKSFSSSRIRSALCRFWTKYGEQISRHERPRGLISWASVILYSNMIEADVINCLLEIVRGRPTIVEEAQHYAVRDGGTRSLQVYQNLREITSRAAASSLQYPYHDVMLERGRPFATRSPVRRRYGYSPLRVRSPVAKVVRHRLPLRPHRTRHLLQPIGNEVALRQDNHELRLRRLENKIEDVQDAVQEELATGAYSPGYHGADYYSDGGYDVEYFGEDLFDNQYQDELDAPRLLR